MSTTYTSTEGINYFEPVDEYDNPVKKTKAMHPYSYDGFVTYRSGSNDEVTSTVYSDRLSQWDWEKTKKLKIKHFNSQSDYWNSFTPKQIEAFLSDYIGSKIKLILIMEYCNAATGYPVWRFDYKTIKNKKK